MALWASSQDWLEVFPPPQCLWFIWLLAWGEAKKLKEHGFFAAQTYQGVLSASLLHAAMSGLHFSAHFHFPHHLSPDHSPCLDGSHAAFAHSSCISPFSNVLFLSCGCTVTNRFFACHTNWPQCWSRYTETKRFPVGKRTSNLLLACRSRITVLTMWYNSHSHLSNDVANFDRWSRLFLWGESRPLFHEVCGSYWGKLYDEQSNTVIMRLWALLSVLVWRVGSFCCLWG